MLCKAMHVANSEDKEIMLVLLTTDIDNHCTCTYQGCQPERHVLPMDPDCRWFSDCAACAATEFALWAASRQADMSCVETHGTRFTQRCHGVDRVSRVNKPNPRLEKMRHITIIKKDHVHCQAPGDLRWISTNVIKSKIVAMMSFGFVTANTFSSRSSSLLNWTCVCRGTDSVPLYC